LEKEVITVWKGGQSRLASGIIWRGCGGVNEGAAQRREELALLPEGAP